MERHAWVWRGAYLALVVRTELRGGAPCRQVCRYLRALVPQETINAMWPLRRYICIEYGTRSSNIFYFR